MALMAVKCITVFLLFFLPAIFSSGLLDSEWHSWKAKHGVAYKNSAEEKHKRNVWEDNYHYVQEHNVGNHTYKLGLNMFADLVRHCAICYSHSLCHLVVGEH